MSYAGDNVRWGVWLGKSYLNACHGKRTTIYITHIITNICYLPYLSTSNLNYRAAHLIDNNSGVLRSAQWEQKSHVEKKVKSWLDFDFQYEYKPRNRGLSILSVYRIFSERCQKSYHRYVYQSMPCLICIYIYATSRNSVPLTHFFAYLVFTTLLELQG